MASVRYNPAISEVCYWSYCTTGLCKTWSRCRWGVLTDYAVWLASLRHHPDVRCAYLSCRVTDHHPDVSKVCYWSYCTTGLCKTWSRCRWGVLTDHAVWLVSLRHHPDVRCAYWSCRVTDHHPDVSKLCYWSYCTTGLCKHDPNVGEVCLLIMLYDWPL